MKPTSFRSHSFRRGAVSWAFNHGVPGEVIEIYGDWVSDAYKAHLEFCVVSKLAFAHQLLLAILYSAVWFHKAKPVFVGRSVWWQQGLLGISWAVVYCWFVF